MAEEEELLRMSRLLIADDIAYRQQLETAVGTIFTLSSIFVSANHFVIPQHLYSKLNSTLLLTGTGLGWDSSGLGFRDTSLTIGECVTILMNYEIRTAQIIYPEQLSDGSLASLLIDEDYIVHDKVMLTLLLTILPY